ncbi:MAG: hypothetical protein K0R52_1038 [Alphaproteobacteria bacterium]|jgi:predicted Holliday junction resolvase-like endonuclease|nr:hypothetical protein [Alphaproteobacteria bacterium]
MKKTLKLLIPSVLISITFSVPLAIYGAEELQQLLQREVANLKNTEGAVKQNIKAADQRIQGKLDNIKEEFQRMDEKIKKAEEKVKQEELKKGRKVKKEEEDRKIADA